MGGLYLLAVAPEDGSAAYHYQFQGSEWVRVEEDLHLYLYRKSQLRERNP